MIPTYVQTYIITFIHNYVSEPGESVINSGRLQKTTTIPSDTKINGPPSHHTHTINVTHSLARQVVVRLCVFQEPKPRQHLSHSSIRIHAAHSCQPVVAAVATMDFTAPSFGPSSSGDAVDQRPTTTTTALAIVVQSLLNDIGDNPTHSATSIEASISRAVAGRLTASLASFTSYSSNYDGLSVEPAATTSAADTSMSAEVVDGGDSGSGDAVYGVAASFANGTAQVVEVLTHTGQTEENNYWALLALVLVVGTAAGNILVCLAITRERRLQNITNYFLMSLAITDLMVAILVMPLGILTLVKGKRYGGSRCHARTDFLCVSTRS